MMPALLWSLLRLKKEPISWTNFCTNKDSRLLPFMEIVRNVNGKMHFEYFDVVKLRFWWLLL